MCAFLFSYAIVVYAAEAIVIDSLCCGVSDELFTPYWAETPLYTRIYPCMEGVFLFFFAFSLIKQRYTAIVTHVSKKALIYIKEFYHLCPHWIFTLLTLIFL